MHRIRTKYLHLYILQINRLCKLCGENGRLKKEKPPAVAGGFTRFLHH